MDGGKRFAVRADAQMIQRIAALRNIDIRRDIGDALVGKHREAAVGCGVKRRNRRRSQQNAIPIKAIDGIRAALPAQIAEPAEQGGIAGEIALNGKALRECAVFQKLKTDEIGMAFGG